MNKIIFGVLIPILLIFTIYPINGTIIKNNKYSENSIICGYVTDFETDEPILNAYIDFFIFDNQGDDYDYEVESDKYGFYIIENVVAGYCVEYGAMADGYHFYWKGDFYIEENETVWINMSMKPLQPKTSKVCGYLINNVTGEPIVDSSVVMLWFDKYNLLNYEGDYTDENGFYTINFGAGRFGLYTNIEGYINQWTIMYNSSGYETFWINFSLDPEVVINIKKPVDGIYYNNKLLYSFYFPIIIGPVDIEINITLYDGNPIKYVEILIDNESKEIFKSEPYIYNWSNITLFKLRHTVEVIVHQYYYYTYTTKKINVWKFL